MISCSYFIPLVLQLLPKISFHLLPGKSVRKGCGKERDEWEEDSLYLSFSSSVILALQYHLRIWQKQQQPALPAQMDKHMMMTSLSDRSYVKKRWCCWASVFLFSSLSLILSFPQDVMLVTISPLRVFHSCTQHWTWPVSGIIQEETRFSLRPPFINAAPCRSWCALERKIILNFPPLLQPDQHLYYRWKNAGCYL